MALEDTLGEINGTLKAILAALQSGATFAGGPSTDTAATSKTKGKAGKDTSAAGAKPTSDAAGAVLEGDAEGTQYWMSKDLADFYKTGPGEAKPPVDNVINVSAAYFASHKAEAAKKSSAAAAQPKDAATGPTATAGQDDASVTFKQVVDRLTVLSKDTKPGRGREGVMTILNKFLADLPAADRKVPKLEALKKNGEILADVEAALSDAPAAEDDPFA